MVGVGGSKDIRGGAGSSLNGSRSLSSLRGESTGDAAFGL